MPYRINDLIQALEQAGWRPVMTDDYSFIVDANVNEGGFFISGVYYPDSEQFSVRANIPIHIPPDRRANVLYFINFANAQFPIGNFEYDEEAQQVFFRNGIFLRDLVVTPQLIHNVVQEAFFAVEDFWSGIDKLVTKQEDVEIVFREHYQK